MDVGSGRLQSVPTSGSPSPVLLPCSYIRRGCAIASAATQRRCQEPDILWRWERSGLLPDAGAQGSWCPGGAPSRHPFLPALSCLV